MIQAEVENKISEWKDCIDECIECDEGSEERQSGENSLIIYNHILSQASLIKKLEAQNMAMKDGIRGTIYLLDDSAPKKANRQAAANLHSILSVLTQ